MIGGNSAVSVGVTMYLRDQFTPNAKKIAASNKELFASIKSESERMMSQQRNMYAGLAMGGALALRGIGSMIKSGAEFGYVMKGVGTVVGSTENQLNLLSDKAKKVGQESIFTSKEVGEGMRFMAMAGQDFNEVMTNIVPATNLAAATMSNLGGKGGAADIMTNVMRGFNIETSRSAEIADKLAYATLRSNTNLYDLGDAVKYSAATAKDLNYQMEDITAAVMTMGNAGIQGSMAGTAIENMMRYVTIASGRFGSSKQKKALDILGLGSGDLRDSMGNMKGLNTVLGIIQSKVNAMGTGEKQDVLQKIFGVRGKRAGSTLLRNLSKYREYLEGIKNASEGGFATKKAEDLMGTMQGTLLKWTNAWENFKIGFSESLEPLVQVLVKLGTGIIKVVNWIMKIPIIGKAIPIIITGFIVLRTVLWTVRSAIAGIALAQSKGLNIQKMFFGNGIMGWKNMTWSVKQYTEQVRAATMARNGLVMGANGGITTAVGSVYSTPKGHKYLQNPKGVRNTRMPNNTMIGPFSSMSTGSKVVSKTALKSTKLLGKTVGILGKIGKGILSFLGPIGMILSVGWLLYDVVGGIFGLQKSEAEKNKEKEVTYDDVMKRFIQARRNDNISIMDENSGYNIKDGNPVGGKNPLQSRSTPVKQTFVFMADGKETMRKEFDDAITKKEYFDNKSIYLLN